MTQGTDENALYGRAVRCKECGCDDPDKLSNTVRMDYNARKAQWVRYEAIECARCGSVTAL